MTSNMPRSRVTLYSTCLCLSLATADNLAAPVDLSDIPLYVLEGVDPNIFLTLDDSGSMVWSYLPNETRWHHDTKRAKSSTFNKLYYNPEVVYSPPVNDYGVSLGNASFTAAWDDGYNRGTCSVDLGSEYRPTWGGDIPHDNCNSDDGDEDEDSKYYGPEFSEQSRSAAFYYVYDGSGDINDDASYDKVVVSDTSGPSGSDERQNFANWYAYYRKRTYTTKTAATLAFANLGTALRTAHQTLNTHSLSRLKKFSDSDRADFFTWINNVPAQGGTPLRYAIDKVGIYLKLAEPYRDDTSDSGSTERSCRQNFHVLMTDGYWNSTAGISGNQDNSNHTLPNNDYGIASYTPRAPYQDNNTAYLADNAFYYWITDLRPTLDNDVPAHVIDTSTDVDGSGAVDNADIFWNPVNDPANWQHLVNYTVGLGVNGTLSFPDDYTDLLTGSKDWNDGDEVDDLWHAAINSRGKFFSADSPQELVSSLQDLLKNILDTVSSGSSASINTGFVSSETKLFQVRFDTSDWTGQLISLPISDGTNNSTCTGANPIGDVCAPEWEAACRLTGGRCSFTGRRYSSLGWKNRTILTLNPDSGNGVPFRWAGTPTDNTVTSAQKNLLEGSDDGATGRRRLNYIRGQRYNELSKGNPNSAFRNRVSLLGDIINSSPVYIGPPSRQYPDALESVSHSSFRTTHANRQGIVYVGANDGMLHGFDAGTGVEKIAYVPNELFPNLINLTAPAYGHSNYVDGPLTEGDAFFSDSSDWHSMVVGGLGLGGQGIFALDATNPSGFAESAAQDLVLWEFTDTQDVDLGYTYGRPAIRKLNNNDWAVIFGNGFNNTEADGSVSSSGTAALYIVNAETGALIKKIPVNKGTADDPTGASRPNGLTDIQPVDRDGDFKVDYVYAGDLFGNVWRFNLTGNDENNWEVAFSGRPLYQAKDSSSRAQPITSLTPVGKHPFGMGVMVYFGTGKYLGKGDIQDLESQSFYGIWDRWFDGDGDTAHNEANFTPFSRGKLLEQDILGTNLVQFAPKDARVTTNNSINWGNQSGWYIDLTESGERVYQDPILRNDRIIFVTVTPSSNPCLGSGSSWLMEMDARDGSRLNVSPFDYSGDGSFSDLDDVNFDLDDDGTAEAVPGSGIRLGNGVYTTPAILKLPADDQERKYMSTSLGTVESVKENAGMGLKRSWQELR